MSQLAIVEAFADLPDTRRTAGQRHTQALCDRLVHSGGCRWELWISSNGGLLESLS